MALSKWQNSFNHMDSIVQEIYSFSRSNTDLTLFAFNFDHDNFEKVIPFTMLTEFNSKEDRCRSVRQKSNSGLEKTMLLLTCHCKSPGSGKDAP